MKEKMIKVAVSEAEAALLAQVRAGGAKIVVSPEKKASYAQLLVEYFKDLALGRDSGGLKNVRAFIENMKPVSRADKWNDVAQIHIFIKNIDADEFIALKKALNEDSALKSWPALGEVWGKKVKDAISTASR